MADHQLAVCARERAFARRSMGLAGVWIPQPRRNRALAFVLLLTARALMAGLTCAPHPRLPFSGSTWIIVSQLIMQVTSQQPPSPAPPLPAMTGHVVAWGSNTNILGFFAGQITIPPEALVNVTAVAGGADHSLALLNIGKVIAWGSNSDGQASVPTTAQSDVKAIAAGTSFSMALRTDGSVLAWGSTGFGQTAVPAAAQSGVVQISACCHHALACLSNGTVVGWGLDTFGQATVPVAAQTGVAEVAAGCDHSVARLSNGTVIAWGKNDYKQISIPDIARAGVTGIAAGASHSLARLKDGQVVAWGLNYNNNNNYQTIIPAGLETAVVMAAGATHTLVLLTTGSVMAWGPFTGGQQLYSVPPEARSNVTTIAAGDYHSLAVVKGAASAPPSSSSPGEPAPTGSSSGVPVGVLVGSVVGGVALLAVVAGGFAYRARRRRAKRIKAGMDIELMVPDFGKAKTHSTTTLSLHGTSQLLPGSADSARRLPGPSNPSNLATAMSTVSLTMSGTKYEKALMSEVRIPWESIKIGRVLGMGGFGTVSRGMWQGNAVAVKMLNVEHMSDTARDELRRETLMMCTLRHPCIASVYGLVDDDTHTALVMRYYPRGSVAAAMHKPEYMNLSIASRLQMALQVASGMCFLHDKGILHGDLKTSNLLVEDTAKGVVLADFGLSCLAGQAVTSGALTVSISPPEVLEHPTAPRTPAGDVYAYSIVLLEIFTGHMTYQGIRSQQVKHLVCDGRRSGIPATVPEGVAAVIKACWAQEAASRPEFAEVMKLLEAAASAATVEQESAEYENVHGQHTHSTRPGYTLADLTSTQT